MAITATTSLTIGFQVAGAGDGQLAFKAEIDSRDEADGGYNKGKTSFRPGDEVFILLYRDPAVVVSHKLTTQGSLLYEGSEIISGVKEFVTFADSDSASVGYPVVSGSDSVTWYGQDLGALSIDNASGNLTIADSTGLVSPYVGVASVEYDTYVDIYRLTGTLVPNETEYSILTYFVGTLG